MDQIKIGKFIQERRKTVGLTQQKLADSLGITDRAVSKWENGRSLPDASLMIALCALLQISINDLLSGEKVDMEDYSRKAERNLLEMKRKDEKRNRLMLTLEIIILVISTLSFVILIILAGEVAMPKSLMAVAIFAACFIFAIGITSCLYLERNTGSYRCRNCGERFVPSWGAFLVSPHMGFSHHLKCPKCGERSWCRKTLEEPSYEE